MERLGVFTCEGCGLKEALDLSAVSAAASESKPAHTLQHPCLCAPEGVQAMRAAVEEHKLDGALIVACSPRSKGIELGFDPRQVAVERVSLREQAIWSHAANDEDTQALAEDLVGMGAVRLAKGSLVSVASEEIERTVLVVGGGLSGLEAARAASAMGHPVVVVEKAEKLGGHVAGLSDLVPETPPYDSLHPNRIADRVAEIENNPAIRIFKSAHIKSVKGAPGRYDVEVETPSGSGSFKAGAIVQATGARPYEAAKLSHLGYGASPNVITSAELEAMLERKELKCPSDGRVPQRVLFVQCAGSRDAAHLPYCSADCCAGTLRQMAVIHRGHPGVQTTVVYKDMRTPGQTERFYQAVQSHPDSLFTRGEVQAVSGNGTLTVSLANSLLGEKVDLDADLVVLATGMVPNSADGEAIRKLKDAQRRVEKGESEIQRAEAKKQVEELAAHDGTEILNLGYRQGPDLPVLRYGFPDSHFICFPYETRRTGIYAAGALHAPMDVPQAAEDGCGAAMKAVQCIESASRSEAVHPRAGDMTIPDFFLQRCTQCKRCTEECPFGTLDEDEKGTPQLNALRCRRCGICMGACPERIISFPTYSPDSVSSMIKAMSVPEEFDEKPRILALLCENDALPALDAAAAQRRTWNAWVRVVPIRCLGSTNLVWIADALSRGIDGVILIGCKRGDDYQCHFVRGSELANYRLDNLQETLTRLALEPERVKVVELAHDESARIPEILDEFAEELDGMGPNPMKGF